MKKGWTNGQTESEETKSPSGITGRGLITIFFPEEDAVKSECYYDNLINGHQSTLSYPFIIIRVTRTPDLIFIIKK